MTLPTAHDILGGVDLTGATAVVTGGLSGIGLATTRALADAGAQVIVATRLPAPTDLAGVRVERLDLADLDSVREFAERFLSRHDTLHLLINNAGVMACPQTRVGPGWEAQFAINHLGHFALTQLLWPALAAAGGARVVALASGRGEIRWDDVHFERGYDKWAAYGQSKHANILFAQHLDRLGAAHGVRAFSAAPGYILTPLQRHLPTAEMVAAGWIDADGTPTPGLFRTPEQGAATTVWAATASAAGGAYCIDCAAVDPVPGDEADAARLWTLSTELTGLDRIR